ncbi:hemerythrin domain-containing protein [Sphingomonas sp.]|uniref:hemerythrin domain-containing protein n=1 Tax=Sphingomonas sp. TaxID=28214 RepID=UPI002B886AA7|nr:hemerythrin domain-containing protein [Sphingomonas sp.]HTG38231.1 hemerythrin domain-containing protein [Sphingomonas sp.]
MSDSPLPPASYARLIAEHEAIAQRAEWLSDACDRNCARSMRAALEELATLLLDHLDSEDHDLHPFLMTSRDGATATAARAARLRYETLARDWLALIAHWEEARIAKAPDDFAGEATALIHRLLARISEEDELLYPAALASGQISLRDRSG